MKHIALLVLAGCAGDDGRDTDDFTVLPDVYRVALRTEPDPPVALQDVEIWLQVLGPDNEPVGDLTRAHERMVHTFVISRDLSSFAHLHHEDFYELTGEDLRNAEFHFPYAFPYSGDFYFSFEFANQGEYRAWASWVSVEGNVPQATEPVVDLSATVESGDIRAELVWDVPPVAGVQAAWHLVLTEVDGDHVTDIVQFLGADGHAAIAATDLSVVGHTHAWVDGMDAAPPGHDMPHEHDGPNLPFRHVFPSAGTYAIWTQFVRAGAPDRPITLAHMIEVP